MRTTTAAAAVLALAFTVAGCGGAHHRDAAPGTHPTATATGTGAAKPPAADADSAAAKAVVTMVDRAETMHSVRTVSVQRRGSSTVTMTTIGSWGGADAGLVVTASPAAFGFQGANHHDRMETRFVHGFEYLQIDPPASGPNKGKTWLRFPLASVAPRGSMGFLSEAMDYSPVHGLLMMPSSGPVTLVGHETVDGRPAVHYRGTKPADAAIVKAQRVPATQQIDVWVGADGLPVRMVSDDGKLRVTEDFIDFGGVVHIQVPPASQTVVPPAPRPSTA
ncbi:hypothetical protein [Streptomyces sp. NPDC020983]|uniref:hypothetical protein n=1 Tax=Streptomyces sp. NPDC020983 TaxID=3365106 RepID=UPI00378922B2